MNLIELIINKMPANLTDLEKARFIYVELGRLVFFDTSLISNTNEEAYRKRFDRQIDITNLDDTFVNCQNWSHIYSDLLNYVGIKNEIKVDDIFFHAWVNVYADKYIIYTDATGDRDMDLSRIKRSDKPGCFSLIDTVGDDEDLDIDNKFDQIIEDIDTKLGYTEEREKFYNEMLKLKHIVMDIPSLAEKMQYIIKHIDLKNRNFFDGSSYLKHVFFNCLGTDYHKIESAKFSKTLLDGSVISIKCFYLYDNGKIHYYIYNGTDKFDEVDKEIFTKLTNMGYSVECYRNIPFIKGIREFTRYDASKKSKTKLQKEALYTKMYAKEDLIVKR